MEKIEMTKRENDVYGFILDFRKQNRCSPSMREIAEGMGLHSASTVCVHIRSLIKKGWLIPYGQTKRRIIPVDEGA
jgi:SOS-response transcriptional repressor LexA